jgi:regulator of replication initiation timing
MLLNDSIKDLIARVTGVDQKITEFRDKFDIIAQENVKLKADNQILQSKIEEFKAICAISEERASQAEAALKSAEEQIVSSVKERDEIKASVEKQAAAKAIEIAAKQGIPPLENTPNEKPGTTKLNNLYGLARVIEAFKRTN